MNWLNRLDNALEEALTPNPSRHGKSSDDSERRRAQSHRQLGADLQEALNDLHEDSSSSSSIIISDEEHDKTPRRRTVSGSSVSMPPEAPASTGSSSPTLPGRLRRQKTPSRLPSTGGSLPGSFKRTSSKKARAIPLLKNIEQQQQHSPVRITSAVHHSPEQNDASPKSSSEMSGVDHGKGIDALERIPASARPPRPTLSKEKQKQYRQQQTEVQLQPHSQVVNAAVSAMGEIPLIKSVKQDDELLGKTVPEQETDSNTRDNAVCTPARISKAEEHVPGAAVADDELDHSKHAASVVSELSTSMSIATPNPMYPGSVRRSRPANSTPTEQSSSEDDTGNSIPLAQGDKEALQKANESGGEQSQMDEHHPSEHDIEHVYTAVFADQLPTDERTSSDEPPPSRPDKEAIETPVIAVSVTEQLLGDETNGQAETSAERTEQALVSNKEEGPSSSENLSFESAVSSQDDDVEETDDSRPTKSTEKLTVVPVERDGKQPADLTGADIMTDVPIGKALESAKEEESMTTQGSIPEQIAPRESDVPRQVLYRSDFDAGSLSGLWGRDQKDMTFDNNMNCRGTVHVRILRAQQLPCSVGSTVQAAVSLKPWKGRVHTPKTTAFFGPADENGVCVQWDEDETKPILMVHSYSDHESPVPRILVDLKFIPLGMFGFTMCTLELDCEYLIMNPLQASRKWFATDSVSPAEPENYTRTRLGRLPLIEIEAMFEPDADALDTISSTSQSGAVGVMQELGPPFSGSSRGDSLLEGGSSTVRERKSLGATTNQSDDLSIPTYSLGASSQRRINTRPHLLQLKTFRTPASCSVCKRSIMSSLWKKKAFRCETCNIDCCGDCRLQVDLQLPCGSEAAKEAVANAIQNKLTMGNLMSVVAPVSEEYATLIGTSSKEKMVMERAEGGIGVLKLEFVRSYVLSESEYFPPESDPSKVLRNKKDIEFHRGDYYMRVTRVGSSDTVRTETIQNSGKPRFDSGEFRLRVPHYGSDFRIELVDAATDKTIGTSIVPTQSLLQRQRDFLIEKEGISLLRLTQKPLVFRGKIRMELELRHDMKSASTMDFFSPHKSLPVVGCAEVLIGLEESLENLYGNNPYVCPPRSPDRLDMNMFQNHLKRIGALIQDLKSVISTYQYVVSWENPLVTGVAFVLFVQLCNRFDPAYLGSLPAFAIITIMVSSAVKRFYGMQKKYFIEKEASSVRQAESVTVEYILHRPIGRIGVTVDRARNLRSPELGLPGNAGCQLFWDPTRLMNEAEKENWANMDASTAAHIIGSTAYVYSANPKWDSIKESEGTKRMGSLLSSDADVFESPSVSCKNEVIFPILQPYSVIQKDVYSLEPWNSSRGALIVEVKFSDLFNVVGSEYTLGEVCIPLSDVCNQNELSGWFHVSTDDYANHLNPATGDDGTPQLYLQIRWLPPKVSEEPVSDIERELSIVLQEEMIRSAILSREQKVGLPGSALVGSSFGALQTVRGLSGNLQMVQNYVGMAVDSAEAARNAFNFTDPWKSTLILAVVAVLWLFFTIVPLRAIVFTIGVLQFILTFFARFGRIFSGRDRNETSKEATTAPTNIDDAQEQDTGQSGVDDLPKEDNNASYHNPVLIWLMNAFHGLPTDEDLRKTYFWESRRFALREAEAIVNEKRKKRLRNLWRAEWYASVQMLCSGKNASDLAWASRFAVVQGHRLLWWDSVGDFDNGNAPTGQVLLAGHAGLATPSPLELKKINEGELDRVVSLFGRGDKVTMLLPSIDLKIELEGAVENALTSKRD